MRLFTKNFLYTTTIIFLVTTLLLGILYVSMPKYYLYTQEKKATKLFDDLTTSIDGKSTDEMIVILTQQLVKENSLIITVTDKNNSIIFPNFLYYEEEIILSMNTLELDSHFNIIQKKISNDKGESFNVTGQYSLQQITDARDILIRLYPFLLLMALILGSLAAFIYSKQSTKRVLSLMDKTTEMRELKPNILCDISGSDEISQLAENINRLYNTHLQTISMLKEEIKKRQLAEESKTNFMRMASHELKTPLAGMTGIIDGMIYNVGKFKDRDSYLLVCQKLLKDQSNLIQNILSATSLDALNTAPEMIEKISIKKVVESQLETYLLLNELEKFTIVKKLDSDSYTHGNRILVEHVISNILSNAFKYTPYGRKISISIKKNILIVENDCTHINNTSINQLFEPFYRIDDSRSKETGGSGLGLYIIKEISEKNNWGLHVAIINSSIFNITIDFNHH